MPHPKTLAAKQSIFLRGLGQAQGTRTEVELDRLCLTSIHRPEVLGQAGDIHVQLAALADDAHQVPAHRLVAAAHGWGGGGEVGRAQLEYESKNGEVVDPISTWARPGPEEA